MTTDELKKNMGDRLWRLNHLYYITNEQGQRVLFKCRPVQLLFFKALHWLNIILKSRQHGITTFCCLMMLDMCLFNSNTKAGIIAHNMQAAGEIFRDKVKYPYSQLPEALRLSLPAIKCDAGQLILNNNSSLMIATSLRSGTYQWVHISEYGKICAKTPERAIEIQSGTLEAVHEGGFITIESTAEGSAGDFYDRCKDAEDLKHRGRELGPMDYRFHFFAWFQDPKNTTDPKFVSEPEDVKEYLDKLENGLDLTLSTGQRAWYVQKKSKLKLLIYREHPSTPDEAFKASIEGSYWGMEMAIAREKGRICTVEYDNHSLVHTIWDLGHKHTAVWFVQFIGQEIRLVDYYIDNDGAGMAEYALMLQDKRYKYGVHYAPWDVSAEGPNGRSMQTGKDLVEVARECGIDFKIVTRCSVSAGIKTAQDIISRCWFDLDKCEKGIRCLEMYRAKWNENTATYEDKPLHDWASHGADAFRYLALVYRYASIKGERVGETKQAIPKKAAHRAYRAGIRKIA